MPRKHAALKVSIWADKDFRSLGTAEQLTYLMLLSQPFITYCGVVQYHVGRFASLVDDQTCESITETLYRLQKRDYIVIDEETGELLVRSFVRHDGLLQLPNVVISMMNDRKQVMSERILDVIDHELRRAWQEGLMADLVKSKSWEKVKAHDMQLWDYIQGLESRPEQPLAEG